ncbi:MAG: hypothetical protein PHR35_15230, partial [Kiritimatiellae bacterium]|nr:hypothetical protein [Kiritimatiellia bacterium]
HSLSGHIRGQGVVNDQRVLRHRSVRFDDGFAACGRVSVCTDVFIAEGDSEDEIAWIDLAFAALPDGRTTVGFQCARLLHRAVVREVKGLFLPIPNDVHNGYRRLYRGEFGSKRSRGYPRHGQSMGTGGLWLSVDNRLGILGLYGGAELTLHQPAEPQVMIRSHTFYSHSRDVGGLLYADEICLGACAENPGLCEPGILFDIGFAIRAGVSARETRAWAQAGSQRVWPQGNQAAIRAVRVAGADGHSYLVMANFGEDPVTARFEPDEVDGSLAVDGQAPVRQEGDVCVIAVDPGAARVIRLND